MILRRRFSGLLALTLLVVLSTPIVAQREQTREGFWFSIGVGGGSLGCEGCDNRLSGPSGQISLGGTLSQKLLLGVSSHGWVKSEDGATLSMVTTTAAIRFYPSAAGGFFLLGGVGVSTVKLDLGIFGDGSKSGGGAVIGLGYDIRVGDNVSLTPYFNASAGTFDQVDANVTQLGMSVTIH